MDSETKDRIDRLVGRDAYLHDPLYHAQVGFVRGLVTRLEMILEDEGVAWDVSRRIINSVLLGIPDGSDAALRVADRGDRVRVLSGEGSRCPGG